MNIQRIKSYLSYFIATFLPLMTFITTLLSFQDFLLSTLICIPIIFLSIVLGRKLSYHPMREMVEGTGFLVMDISSKGVIKPIVGKLDKQFFKIPNASAQIFDRNQVFAMELPRIAKATVENGKLIIDIPKKEHYFSFENFYPTFLYNSQINMLYDKNTIGEFEIKYLTKYNLNYIKVKVEELSGILRDFARYVVELSKPQSIFQSKWIFVVIGLVVLAFIILAFMPTISSFLTPQAQATQTGGSLVVGR